MLAGVISDTHDNLLNLRKAVDIFIDKRIEVLLHGGDFCSPFVFRELERLKSVCPKIYAVFGNNDGDRFLLKKEGDGYCEISNAVHIINLSGRNIVIMHYPDVAESLHRSGEYDLVIFGHTHRAVVKGNEKKLLNPGACSGYMAEKATIATVDTDTMHVELIGL